jgi:23S rRNA (uracil1939-C5)-methyltransferase
MATTDSDALIEVEIESLGARGDGIAAHRAGKLFVPFALPGERVRVRAVGEDRAAIVERLSDNPQRIAPPCRHFGTCGGCALQHLGADAYADWKVAQLRAALAPRGLGDVTLAPLVRVAPKTRRRAEFASRRTKGQVQLGFHARLSHDIVDMAECHVLAPAIVALVAPLRALMQSLASIAWADLMVTQTDTGIDLLLTLSAAPDRAAQAALIAFADAHDLARVSWRKSASPELIVERRKPQIRFGGVAVDLPAGAFLQAAPEAEAALVGAVTHAVGKAKRVIDLYAGCGTFTLPLAHKAQIHAIEGAADLTQALDAAARRGGVGPRVRVERRDLNRRPLLPEELREANAIVFDPPREGAREQAAYLAQSGVKTIVGVSCNPATFARDARTLVDGGYTLEQVTPVDQFLWTPHLELVGVFRRT